MHADSDGKVPEVTGSVKISRLTGFVLKQRWICIQWDQTQTMC